MAVALSEEFRYKYFLKANGKKTVGIVSSGGNVDISEVCELMEKNGICL